MRSLDEHLLAEIGTTQIPRYVSNEINDDGKNYDSLMEDFEHRIDQCLHAQLLDRVDVEALREELEDARSAHHPPHTTHHTNHTPPHTTPHLTPHTIHHL